MQTRFAIAVAFAALFGGGSVHADGHRGEGDAERGLELAKRHCARCHVIKSYNPYGGAGNTPSFDRLVTWDNGIWRMSTFFDRPPHPVFVRMEGVPEMENVPPTAHPFELTREDLADIVAFAKALRAEKGD